MTYLNVSHKYNILVTYLCFSKYENNIFEAQAEKIPVIHSSIQKEKRERSKRLIS